MAAIVCLASGSVQGTYTGLLENGGDLYRCVNAGWTYVHELTGQKYARVWYNNDEKKKTRDAGSEFAGLYLWSSSFVNRAFPDLSKVEGSDDILPGEVVVVVTRQAGRPAEPDATIPRLPLQGNNAARYLGSRDFQVGASRLPVCWCFSSRRKLLEFVRRTWLIGWGRG